MSNLDNTNANEQLFAELTFDEGSAITGGHGYQYKKFKKYRIEQIKIRVDKLIESAKVTVPTRVL